MQTGFNQSQRVVFLQSDWSVSIRQDFRKNWSLQRQHFGVKEAKYTSAGFSTAPEVEASHETRLK